jgi:hypothetical protein
LVAARADAAGITNKMFFDNPKLLYPELTPWRSDLVCKVFTPRHQVNWAGEKDLEMLNESFVSFLIQVVNGILASKAERFAEQDNERSYL